MHTYLAMDLTSIQRIVDRLKKYSIGKDGLKNEDILSQQLDQNIDRLRSIYKPSRILTPSDLQNLSNPSKRTKETFASILSIQALDNSDITKLSSRRKPQRAISPQKGESVIIIGFLNFNPSNINNDTLYISDENASIQVELDHPTPNLLNNLIMIPSWSLIQSGMSYITNKENQIFNDDNVMYQSNYMEVSKCDVLLYTAHPLFFKPSVADLGHFLESNYSCKSPLFSGKVKIATHLVTSIENQTSHLSVPDSSVNEYKHRKKSNHIVIGRLVACSAISRQKCMLQNHFVIRMESLLNDSVNIIDILFRGMKAIHWHPFLIPGNCYVVTDLIKIKLKENSCILFQATTSSKDEKGTILWQYHQQELQKLFSTCHVPSIATNALDHDRNQYHHECLQSADKDKTLVTYAGKISKIVCENAFEFDNNSQLVLWLHHYPHAGKLAGLRVGCKIKAHNVHILFNSKTHSLLGFGACLYSKIEIIEFSDEFGYYLSQSKTSRAPLLELERICLPNVLWILDLNRMLIKKFGSMDTLSKCLSNANTCYSSGLKSKCIISIAKSFGMIWKLPPILISSFIDHSSSNCFSIQQEKETFFEFMEIQTLHHIVKTCKLMIQEKQIKIFGSCLQCQLHWNSTFVNKESNQSHIYVIGSNDLKDNVLFGMIEKKNEDNNNNKDFYSLFLKDQTGKLRMMIIDETTNRLIDSNVFLNQSVIWMKEYYLIIQMFPQQQYDHQTVSLLEYDNILSIDNQIFSFTCHVRVLYKNIHKVSCEQDISSQCPEYNHVLQYLHNVSNYTTIRSLKSNSTERKLSSSSFMNIRGKIISIIPILSCKDVNASNVPPSKRLCIEKQEKINDQRYFNDKKKSLLIKLQDENFPDSIDIFMPFDHYTNPFIFIHGNILGLERLCIKISGTGKMYFKCTSSTIFHLIKIYSLHEMEKPHIICIPYSCKHPNELKKTMNEIEKLSRLDERVWEIQGNFVYLRFIVLKMKCYSCDEYIVNENSMDNRTNCLEHTLNNAYLHSSAKGIFDDGTSQTDLYVDGDIIWKILNFSSKKIQLYKKFAREQGCLRYLSTVSSLNSKSSIEQEFEQDIQNAPYQRVFKILCKRFIKKNISPQESIIITPSIIKLGDQIIHTNTKESMCMEAIDIEEICYRNEIQKLLWNS